MYACAALLLRQGADVNAKDESGRTPLHEVAVQDAFEVAELLLRQGADVHAKDGFGYTPLHEAAEKDASRVAEALRCYGGR